MSISKITFVYYNFYYYNKMRLFETSIKKRLSIKRILTFNIFTRIVFVSIGHQDNIIFIVIIFRKSLIKKLTYLNN